MALPTTERKAVKLTSWPESIYPVFFIGTQPFSIPSLKSIPEANSLPRSIQVSLQFSPVNLSLISNKLPLILISSFRQTSKARPPSPSTMKQRPASPQSTPTKPPPIQKPALTPTGPPTLRKRDSKSKDLCPVQAASPQPSESSKSKDKDGESF